MPIDQTQYPNLEGADPHQVADAIKVFRGQPGCVGSGFLYEARHLLEKHGTVDAIIQLTRENDDDCERAVTLIRWLSACSRGTLQTTVFDAAVNVALQDKAKNPPSDDEFREDQAFTNFRESGGRSHEPRSKRI